MLEALAGRHDLAGVVTQPDRPAGRGQRLVATPVKRAAEARGIPVHTPERLKPFAADVPALGVDAFVVASYGKIVPQVLLDAVPIAFNVHPSLLPLYRGATPLQSAIRDGRSQTGVTIIAMDAGMDTGDVLLQEAAAIGPDETYGQLHDRLARRGAELAVEALERYAAGTLPRKTQAQRARELGVADEEIAATLTRPLRKEDLVLDNAEPAQRIVDRVRSLAPAPAGRTDVFGETIKVLRAHVAPDGEGVSSAAPMAYLHAGDGRAVALDQVVPPGRGPMAGEAYARSWLQRHR